MSERSVETAVLGSGPAGLAAAYVLGRAGRRVVVIERGKEAGGLMRSIRHGEYSVDVGRKELYSRLPDVHGLWSELLGADYRPYPHRIGVLYQGHVIERSRAFRGFRRGMPWPLLLRGAADLVVTQLANPFRPAPRNEEEFWYRARGRVFSVALSQGYKEKFSGKSWAELPAPASAANGGALALGKTALKGIFGRAIARDHGRTEWKHPAKGSGQITWRLKEEIERAGNAIDFGVAIDRAVVEGDRISRLEGTQGDERVTYRPEHVVAGVPLDILAKLLGREPPRDIKAQDERKRSTLIVYLFLDHPPLVDHAWIDVSDPALRAGRITNYAGFGGDMVPPGHTCLAVEYFLLGDDPLLKEPDESVVQLALRECEAGRLIDRSKLEGSKVFRFPGAFAADDYRSWQSPGVRGLLKDFEQVGNLYYVNRAGTDVATQAGIEAARAIIAGDRGGFLTRADPTRPIGIESTRLWKA